ncbi:hypothetical protein NDU88_001190 [Pleurodeles waltl]|uniref:Tyrosine-protein kinase n=2 Tax=Pleurodeles waltl TaxID=8319 RepID=A0AAV7PBT9_PLEWA|nr:hypothetical protein NDU88_001190 [Pleurodeles waltl]
MRAAFGQLYVSLWDFQARTEEEVSFRAGELLLLLEEQGDWWKAEVVDEAGRRSGRVGYVPRNYLAEQETGDTEPWFFGELSRTEAGNILMSPENKRGTFLVRASEKQGFDHALSVRDQNCVRHFKILQNKQGKFHVNTTSFFSDLESLIQHYTERSLIDGLLLTTPCMKKGPDVNDFSEDTADVWERQRDEFELTNKLGSGNFGDVYEAMWTSGRVPVKVAIKVMKAVMTCQNDFRAETQFMKRLQHRHLLPLYAVCSQADPYYIIMEFMPKGDLLNLLRGSQGKNLLSSDLLDMAYQVVDGMEYLEARNYIHRDLAARNILVGKDNLCKVADFGMARIVKDDVYLSQIKNIPYRWTAPEALLYGRFSTKADVWSFGVLLFEIITHGQSPYPGLSNSEVLPEIERGYRMPQPKDCPYKVYNVMLSCWENEPQARPTFATLKANVEHLICYEETEYCP